MSLAELSFFSKPIGMHSRMRVLLPDAGDGPFPVLYLLHGLSDDCTIWLRRTALERYMAGIPLIVVMPETGRGWYVNAAQPPGRRYEDHFMQGVIGHVERWLPVIRERRGRAIGGLSMGGFGAVKLGLTHPDTFCSITSLSGAVLVPVNHAKDRKKDPALHAEFDAIFGKKAAGGPNDCLALARQCPKDLRPALRLDCGTEDFLLPQNRYYHLQLKRMGFPHEYAEYPGDHNWAYWDAHIMEAVRFHCVALGVAVK